MTVYTTLYLRADSESAMAATLPSWLRPDGSWRLRGDGFAFDPIGTLFTAGAFDYSAESWVSLAEPKPGWHANLRCTQSLAAAIDSAVTITPATPDRVFA